MKTILVTGGAGFIGGHLVEQLVAKNTVVVVDNLSTGKIENLPDEVIFINGDISNPETVKSLFENFTFDFVYHLAAVASVVKTVNEPVASHYVNSSSTIYLLEACKEQEKQIEKFVFASSAAVYGAEPTLPKTEKSLIDPITPYGIDKYSSEKYVISYGELFGLPVSVARFFNVYGPRQNPDSPYSGVLSILANTAIQLKEGSEKPFSIYGDGEQIRDFVYVQDIVQGLIILGENKSSRGEVFNIASGEKNTLNDVISLFEKLIGQPIPKVNHSMRKGDIKYSFASIDKIKQLGYVPYFNILDGLEAYLNFEIKVLA
ncbi:UDP-glucose 4-epimerase [Listeria fleischmannii 1991]|uniref:dTDP-glucose 4,6-dehydratase n=2 Tax=Listeria fleischmannii TaxID=1069827 RepID=A0A2X3H787_9LIST|nr:NAD-dependent epimerase/dehydratase family protein [Listeria fleischmannii]EMG26702.1 VI polysaccharide biosynthesis protein VipB/tviC [Listeria fleischmannii subsp. fleischmannii LU2006-1]KMT61432.1 UDP-glucose 4-epimerase [Listeria fleischmannii 1991]SQC70406.1 dTDP-glucose 4,6-dehydratase [Listeria fleischmannii subsp. fleischmannii]